MARAMIFVWMLGIWAAQATALFAIVYLAARMAIRHERR